jgi:outer membrane protein assembly factor BamB
MTDTEACCAEALQRITNQNLGYSYQAWIAWWKQNGSKSREEWIRDGFAQASLPVCDPADDRFATALFNTLLGKEGPAENAWYLLKQLPSGQLLRCIDACMGDPSPLARKAAAEALGRWKADACRPRLRTLCKDDEPEIRELALTRLDEILGEIDAQPAEGVTIWKTSLGSTTYPLYPGPDEDHVLVATAPIGHPNLQPQRLTVDLAHRQAAPADEPVAGPGWCPSTHNGRVYETSWDGNVECRDEQTGRALWSLALGEGDVRDRASWGVKRPVFLNDKVVVVGWSFIAGLDPADGRILWKRPIEEGYHALAQAGEYLYVGNAGKIRKVSADGQIVAQRDYPPEAISFLVCQDCLYVVGQSQGGAPGVLTTMLHTVTACSPDSLKTLWEYVLPAGQYPTFDLQRVEDVLVIPAHPGMIALDASSGSHLWSTVERGAHSLGGLPDGSLAVSDSFQLLEIRDRHNGEVIRSYGGIRLSIGCPPLYLPKHGLVCADVDGQLWLLRWPLGGSGSSAPTASRPAR